MKFKHKFKAKPVTDDGQYFASTLEHKYKKHLDMLIKTGDVVFYLQQIPLRLTGNVKYVVDFLVFYSDGSILFEEVKGIMTDVAKIKIKQAEELYPINIKIIKKGDF
jgi:hypothetical protein